MMHPVNGTEERLDALLRSIGELKAIMEVAVEELMKLNDRRQSDLNELKEPARKKR